MGEKFFPERLFELGYTDLISVIPPGAQLTPTSKISPSSCGKAPGRKLSNGLYAGYDWRKFEATASDVQRWCMEGSSVGIRANRFPGLDIDTMDPHLAQIIEDAALAKLGPAPIRIGRAPKRLLMYRAAEPFSRMRLFIRKGGEQHLVEILGEGQQYVIYGTHPATQRPYTWESEPGEYLTVITREQADSFLEYLEGVIGMLSIGSVTREGRGDRLHRASADQSSLVAPSIDILRDAVARIPNTDELFPGRDEYIKMGYAIRAASGHDIEEGYHIFADWAGRHEADGRVAGNPETWLGDWRRMAPPFSLGWSWIAEQARSFGFNDAVLEFDALETAPPPPEESSPTYSDQWLAELVVARRSEEMRYVPQHGHFIVWNKGRWEPDAELLAEDIVKRELRNIANQEMRKGATAKEVKEAQDRAIMFCSAGKSTAVRGLVQSDRNIATSLSALDSDPWLLNTPIGIIDLRTGDLGPPDPDALCTRSTSVPIDYRGTHPEWDRFLNEATRGDKDLIAYMQRLCGYALTGSTREQSLVFIYGPGGNGKSIFVNVLSGILGDYAKVASMDTFTASQSEQHSTNVAMLNGARLVTASETQAGKRWDEAKVKNLTGGEPVTARFMRQDNFTFLPQFKLVFIGNHKPELRDIDAAMRRRIQMVPFTVEPKKVDTALGEKLRAEWPAILAWMVAGSLEWQRIGLAPPKIVLDTTLEYFEEEDPVGRWMKECVEHDASSFESSTDLFHSWREWANENGEYVGSMKRLCASLVARKIDRDRGGSTRRMGFKGLRIINRNGIEAL